MSESVAAEMRLMVLIESSHVVAGHKSEGRHVRRLRDEFTMKKNIAQNMIVIIGGQYLGHFYHLPTP